MVRIVDLALKLGLSPTTVSHVMTGKHRRYGIGQKTAERVARMAKELGYRPSYAARALQSNRSNAVGLVVPDLLNPFWAGLATATEQAAERHGYTLFVCSSHELLEREERMTQMLQERQVDGLILSPARLKDRSLEVLRGQERPFVLIDRNVENASLPCVMTDNRAGSAMAVDYLIRKGHSSIAYVGGPLQQMTGRDRFEGFKSAMAAHALEPAGLATIDAAFEKAVAAASALLRRRPRPTAIFAGNLTITLGAMEAVRAARLSVPSDIELVGFDDIPHAELMRYPVTTIAQQVEAMGREAFRLLLRQMKNDSPGDLVLLPPRLIVRQ